MPWTRWFCYWVIFTTTFLVVRRLINEYQSQHDVFFHNPENFRLSYEAMEKNFKVFVYPEGRPPSVLSLKYLFRIPYSILPHSKLVYPFILKNILESRFWTEDPNQAHLFFPPFTRRQDIKNWIAYKGKFMKVEDYVERIISSKHPYWNRTNGADHFFVGCDDFNLKRVQSLTNNPIFVTCPSSVYDNSFVPHKDVSLPRMDGGWRSAGASDIIKRLFVWGGSVNDFSIYDNAAINQPVESSDAYQEPRFCTVGVDRVVETILKGCIPVIVSDRYDTLPLSDILDWRKFSLMIKEEDWVNMHYIQENSDYTRLHQNMLKVQRHFIWNSPPIKYDAFHMVMYELWLRHNATRN